MVDENKKKKKHEFGLLHKQALNFSTVLPRRTQLGGCHGLVPLHAVQGMQESQSEKGDNLKLDSDFKNLGNRIPKPVLQPNFASSLLGVRLGNKECKNDNQRGNFAVNSLQHRKFMSVVCLACL